MINQTSYEQFGYGLFSSAEKIVYAMLVLMLKLHKQIIKNPDDIYKYQKYYEDELNEIANFEKDWQDWIDYDLSMAYLSGLKQAENQLKENKLNTDIIKSIASLGISSLLLRKSGSIAGVPNVPGEILNKFKKYPGHISLLNAFRAAVFSNFQNQKFQIIRKGRDIFREIAILAGEKMYKEADIFTRRKMSQLMLDEYAKRGIQTITYKNGSKYSIDSYCEMVGRTMTGRAAVQASLNRFFESGYTLVVVSAHFRACDLCTPYEGKTLSIEQHPVYESVADAELQGLFHSRCAHDVSVWWEGKGESDIPRVHSGEQQLIDQYGYEEAQKIAYSAQQKQRYIERNIRNWKRRIYVSLNEKQKKFANQKVREWQAKQREHLRINNFLPRKYSREQIRRAH
jgi:hypothetical protein